jgi:hypothetical protein
MAIGPGNKRFNITLPEKVYADLQAEAESSERTVSEVILKALEQSWRTPETVQEEVRHLVVTLTELVEREFATVQQHFGNIGRVLDRVESGPEQETHSTKPPMATYEQMYGPILRREPPAPTPPRAPVKPRKRWRIW